MLLPNGFILYTHQVGGIATRRSITSYPSLSPGGTRHSFFSGMHTPLFPYARDGGTTIFRSPPGFMVATAASSPSMTCRWPIWKTNPFLLSKMEPLDRNAN